MATIVTRAGKGSPLTNTELDSNFTNINAELSTAVITGGTINGATIGATTAAAITGTTITGTTITGTTFSGAGTSLTGTATALSIGGNAATATTAGTVTTNANLTGPITSVGNATSIASQTGTGTKFVVDNTPTLITPVLGVASATSVTVSGVVGTSATDSLIIPSGTTAERGASTAGKIRYNSTTSSFEGYGAAWGALGGGNSTTKGMWVNSQTINEDITVTTGNSATSTGPITIAAGKAVTLEAGVRWMIL